MTDSPNTSNPITERRLKERKALIWAGLIAAALVGVISFVLTTLIKWKFIDHDVGWGSEVRRKPVFAAQAYLEKQGVETEFRRSFVLFDKLDANSARNSPGANDTIILFNSYGVINEARYRKLSPWLYNGGTLITSSYNPHNTGVESDELFFQLGVNVDKDVSFVELREGETKEAAQRRVSIRNTFIGGFFGELTDELDSEKKQSKEKKQENIGDGEFLKRSSKTETVAEAENSEEGSKESSEKGVEESLEESSSTQDDETTEPDLLASTEENDPEKYKRYDPSVCPALETPTQMDFSSESQPLNIHFNSGRLFHFDTDGLEAEGWISVDDGVVFAQFMMGQGQVYVTVNNHIWWNRNLGCLDNAYLLTKLVNHNGKVWFVQNMEAPALSEAAWKFAPAAIVGFIISVVLWLWFTSRRFGPVFSERDLSRRSFAEHLRAHARFLWRKHAHQKMIDSLRLTIFNVLSRKISRFDELPQDEKLDHLEALFKLDRTDLYRAFIKPEIDDENELIKTVQCLKHIKDSL